MNFQDTWKLLQEGEVISRSSWDSSYIALLPNVNHIWYVDFDMEGVNSCNYTPTIQDLLANDWQVLE